MTIIPAAHFGVVTYPAVTFNTSTGKSGRCTLKELADFLATVALLMSFKTSFATLLLLTTYLTPVYASMADATEIPVSETSQKIGNSAWFLGVWSFSQEECRHTKYQFKPTQLFIRDLIEGTPTKEITPVSSYEFKDSVIYVHLSEKHSHKGWVFSDNTMRFRQIDSNQIAIQRSLAGGEVPLVRCKQKSSKK